jgi:hypothetical protein
MLLDEDIRKQERDRLWRREVDLTRKTEFRFFAPRSGASFAPFLPALLEADLIRAN